MQGEHIRGKNEQKAGTFAADQVAKPDLIYCEKYHTKDLCGRLSECIGEAMNKGREELCELVCSRNNCQKTLSNPLGDNWRSELVWVVKEKKKTPGGCCARGGHSTCLQEARLLFLGVPF